MKAVCQQVGMPIEPEKDEGPATTIGKPGQISSGGIPMLAGPGTSHQVTITSDASGSWGCGAFMEEAWLTMVRVYQGQAHHGEGAGGHCDCRGNLGTGVEREVCACLL